MRRIVTIIALMATIFAISTSARAETLTSHDMAVVDHAQMAAVTAQQPEKILVIGGSITHGWFDSPKDRGFVRIAFQQLAQSKQASEHASEQASEQQSQQKVHGQSNQQLFAIYNHGIPGAGVLTVRHRYPRWLREIHPQVVVIAWGTLNDIHHKLPMKTFRAQIRDEINAGLDAGASVIIVTPPVSRVSYTSYRALEPRYLANEIAVARTYPANEVEVINVFQQMKAYVKLHGINIQAISHDGWHPNPRGHEIAARILLQGLEQGSVQLG